VRFEAVLLLLLRAFGPRWVVLPKIRSGGLIEPIAV
jgi:hypothetical protein